MRLVIAGLLAALAAGPAAAQQADPAQPSTADDPAVIEGAAGADATDDCAFLTGAFAGLYEGLRAEAGGDIEDADPVRVTMFTAIQGNTILLAQAAGCDVGPMIEIARAQLGRYHPGGVPVPE